MAGKGEVSYFLSSAMLSRDNVFNMECEVGIIFLVDSAILTTVVSPLANKVLGGVIHYAFGELKMHARALSRMSATKSISSMYVSYSLASSADRAPSFALFASSSRRA